jgi:hypothetical protein
VEHASYDLLVDGITIILGFVIIPVWILAGFADYFCHRAADIEHTAGTRESVLHFVQFGLVGIPLTATLFLEVNAGMLVAIAVFIVLHHAVAYIDVRYANATREVRPLEQMIHSFLEFLPIAAFMLLAALEFDQLQALVGSGPDHADFALRLRSPMLPLWYITSVLVAAFLIDLAPYAEELARCLRAARPRATD